MNHFSKLAISSGAAALTALTSPAVIACDCGGPYYTSASGKTSIQYPGDLCNGSPYISATTVFGGSPVSGVIYPLDCGNAVITGRFHLTNNSFTCYGQVTMISNGGGFQVNWTLEDPARCGTKTRNWAIKIQ